jgi:predicted DNA-binding transcriptional regulator AlpA
MNSAKAAKFIGLSVWWLVKARSNGTGPKFIKIGRAVRYSRASLLDFIKRNTHD